MNKIQKVLNDIRLGKFVIVVDDPDRENEGDFVIAAEAITPEKVNFLLEYGRGLICTPLSSELAEKLKLERMIRNNTSKFSTAFTISIDATSGGSGISASDRSLTIKLLTENHITAEHFDRPGHIFPLIAADGGLQSRDGHTEASIELMKLSNMQPVAVICEILNKQGEIATSQELKEISQQFDIPIISIKEIKEHLLIANSQKLASPTVTSFLPTEFGDFELSVFKIQEKEVTVLVKKGWLDSPLVRIHSECKTGDLFSSFRCDCGPQLQFSMKEIQQRGGILIYLPQEGRGIGLIEKLKAYNLQDQGLDTADANLKLGHQIDGRTYDCVGQILSYFKVAQLDLITNNPDKVQAVEKMGFQIKSIIHTIPEINEHNFNYINTKINKFNHSINLGSRQ
jgi:3,4-dihydroxy 2-butanone 4-phosphate synthase/GTP cyclohydrolase II